MRSRTSRGVPEGSGGEDLYMGSCHADTGKFRGHIGIVLARDSIVGMPIPCSISLPASLFTRSITHHPVINPLVTLCTLWWCPTEWAQRYLSVTRSDKSQSRFVPTQQTLSEIPVVHLYSHPVTLWRLVHPKHSYDIRELHNLMV